jgi:hypothetical protein
VKTHLLILSLLLAPPARSEKALSNTEHEALVSISEDKAIDALTRVIQKTKGQPGEADLWLVRAVFEASQECALLCNERGHRKNHVFLAADHSQQRKSEANE